MALSGSVSTNTWQSDTTTNTWKVVCNWTATQDAKNNTSTISWDLKVSSTSSSYVVISELRLKFGSEEIFYRNQSNHTNGYNGTALASGTKVIKHNDDGTKSFNISVEAGIYNWAINKSGSGEITLNPITRSSSITYAGNVAVGGSCNIKWNHAIKGYKYKLKFAIGDWNDTTDYIVPSTIGEYNYTSYTFSDEKIYQELRSATSGTMKATLTTYNSSGTKIGSSSSETFRISVPSGDKPTIGSINIEPIGSDVLVKGKNKIRITVSGCTASTGSTIKSYSFNGPNVSSTINSTSDNITFESDSVISTSGALTYTVTLKDSRGKTVKSTIDITCFEYSKPSFTSFSAYRCNSTGSPDDKGTHIKYDLVVKYSNVDNNNDVTVIIYYKTSNGNWTAATTNALTDSKNTSTSGIIKNGNTNVTFEIDSTYLIRAEVIDNYNGSVYSSTVTIFGSSRILNISQDGTGIAFGKMAESNNLFECMWPAKFDSDIEADGNVTFDGDVVFNGSVTGLPEPERYTLPTASTSTLGGVKVDGSTVTIKDGTISAKQYTLPTASSSTLGGVKVDDSSITINNGVISAKQHTIKAMYNKPGATGNEGTNLSFSGSYDLIIVGSTPSSGNAVIFTTLPGILASDGVTFQVADEESFTRWKLSSTGISRDTGTGNINYLYGIKL